MPFPTPLPTDPPTPKVNLLVQMSFPCTSSLLRYVHIISVAGRSKERGVLVVVGTCVSYLYVAVHSAGAPLSAAGCACTSANAELHCNISEYVGTYVVLH